MLSLLMHTHIAHALGSRTTMMTHAPMHTAYLFSDLQLIRLAATIVINHASLHIPPNAPDVVVR